MYFSEIPPQHAPLGGELRYTLAGPDAGGLDIQILDPATRKPFGAKRIAGIAGESFDAAPCIRRSLLFVPTGDGTGFRRAQGRTQTVVVEISEGNGIQSASASRTFLATTTSVWAPALLSSMPQQRIIAPGECDELTLFTTGPCAVTITAETADATIAENHQEDGEGLHLFRVDLRDFMEAETITVDAGACGIVVYTVDRTPHRGRRLAWRTDAGSIEHYTFPVEKSKRIEVAKEQAYGPEGHVATKVETEVRTALESAFETRPVLESLAEVLSAPQVWLADGDHYTPVDVGSGVATPHRHDAVGTFEIEIRPSRKIRSPWR